MAELISVFYELIGYWTARAILPVISFGRWSVEPLGVNMTGFNHFGVKRRPGGGHVVSSRAAGWIGCCVWLAALAVYLFAFRI